MTEDLKNRTCATCACAWVAQPPTVPTAQQLQENPDLLTAKPTRICRLNPPTFVMTQRGSTLMQQVVADYMSCWHWKPPGTLPGDVWAIPSRGESDPHDTAGKLVLA
jgi:hypothetical protein